MRAAWRFGWRLFVVLLVGLLIAAWVVLTLIGFIQGDLDAPIVALYVASLLMVVAIPVVAAVSVVATVVIARRRT